MARRAKHSMVFNDRAIRALRAREVRTEYRDAGLEGFGLRVYPSGAKAFFVRYRTERGERRYILGDYSKVPLADARTRAKDLLGRAARGEDPQGERRERRAAPTFGELAGSYLEVHAKQRKRSWKEDERMLRRDLLPAWRGVPAEQIRRRDIARVLDAIAGRGAPIMANRVRALASKIFAFGLQRGFVEFNPVAGLDKPGLERQRQRVLCEDEIRALWQQWEAEGSVSSAAFRMLLVTGQRKHEVLGMRWADIHGAWWTIPEGIVKNKLAHRVYLSAEALRLLASLEPLTGRKTWVFASPRRAGTSIASLNTAKRRSRTATAIHDWRPHDLRRTAATYMGRMGVARTAIARVLNHVDSSVTAIYDRSTGEPEIEHALRVWGQRLDEIVRGRQPVDNVVSIR